MSRDLDPAAVAWLSAETVIRGRREQVVKRHRGDAEALIAKLDALDDTPGEYRIFPTKEVVEGVPGTAVENGVVVHEPEDGVLVVWIDEAEGYVADDDDGVGLDVNGKPHPDGLSASAGHFEVYDPAKHGEPYVPIPSRRGMPAVEAPRVSEGEA